MRDIFPVAGSSRSVVEPIEQDIELHVMDLMLAVTSTECTHELSDTLLANKSHE